MGWCEGGLQGGWGGADPLGTSFNACFAVLVSQAPVLTYGVSCCQAPGSTLGAIKGHHLRSLGARKPNSPVIGTLNQGIENQEVPKTAFAT
eukprot:14379400-Alexandrium_andersonii.AAC.1